MRRLFRLPRQAVVAQGLERGQSLPVFTYFLLQVDSQKADLRGHHNLRHNNFEAISEPNL